MQNKLARSYGFGSLLRFSLPTIVMMVFMAMYMTVDGLLVTRLISPNALAAINIVYPIVSVIMAVGIMLGSGGSAVVARKMGEQQNHQARQDFTRIILIGIGIGLAFTAIGLLCLDPILRFFQTPDSVYALASDYARVLLLFTVPAMLQMLFQVFFVTAGKPTLGLAATILGGVLNAVLDYVFIALCGMGIAGAALATGIGYSVPAVAGLILFAISRRGVLHFVRPAVNGRVLFETLANGASEMVTHLSGAVITFMLNILMIRYLGEDGIAAITIVFSVEFLISAIYMGYASGIAPIISYNYGEQNIAMEKKLFRISVLFLSISSIAGFGVVMLLAGPMVGIFVPAGTAVYHLAVYGFKLYAISLLFKGINIFASSFFTALSDGKTSAFLSLMRTLVFIVLGLMFLPRVMGADGIWLAIPLAELLSIVLSILFFRRQFSSWQARA